MALQIANPNVVCKVERLAKAMGITKTAVIEQALDQMIAANTTDSDTPQRMAALLAQLDQIPDRPDAFDPLDWDEQGLPR